MRVVELQDTEDGKRIYTHLYTAIRAGEVRGIEQIRRVGKILDKIEAVGVKEQKITKDPESGDNVVGWRWRLADGGGELWLEDAEFSELESRMGQVGWHPDASRAVGKTHDFLTSAPTRDPKPKLVTMVPPAEPAVPEAPEASGDAAAQA